MPAPLSKFHIGPAALLAPLSIAFHQNFIIINPFNLILLCTKSQIQSNFIHPDPLALRDFSAYHRQQSIYSRTFLLAIPLAPCDFRALTLEAEPSADFCRPIRLTRMPPPRSMRLSRYSHRCRTFCRLSPSNPSDSSDAHRRVRHKKIAHKRKTCKRLTFDCRGD